ncbi:AAA family ATPase [Paenisporosarcina macmurdoensis]|uniref:AAA family ATPase n=1 Tax=Paenisporosarcina macmurdoensis TaxID=212659 RepID=A0ABW1L6Q2_9BACL
MHIQKLVIFGFGQHEDITIALKDGINVFFGLNEAGKTTIQQFLLSVLFGFPLRNQGLLRYEPKGGGRHGGQVHMVHPEFGKVVIERVKGKSAGDVTVYFEDGTRGEEDALKKVLYRYDRVSFESIFSFSIHQLQNFDKMTEEELSRTLLASGTTGVEAITKLEQRATKEMNSLFKKSGKIPEMNVKIEEIRALEQSLKEARMKIDQYEPAILRITEVDQQLEILKTKENQLQKRNEQLAKYRQAKPLLEQQIQLEGKISAIEQQSFPAEGIRRYETLKDRVQELHIQIEQLQQAILQVKQKMNDTSSFNRFKEMDELLSKETEWHHWNLRKQQLTNELEQSKLDMQQQARLLGIKTENHFKQVMEMNVSLQKEEYFQQVMHRLQQAEETIRFDMQSSERSQIENEEVDRKLSQLKSSSPSEADRQQVGKLNYLIRQMAELKARQQIETEPITKKTNTHFLVSTLILLASIIGAISFSNWGIAIGGILLAAVVFVLLKNMNQPPVEKQSNDYGVEIVKLEQQLSMTEQLAERLRLYNDRLLQLTEQHQDRLQMTMKIEENLLASNLKREEAKQTLNEFLKLNGFDGLIQTQLFPELFKRIRQIQEMHQLISRKSQELQTIGDQIHERLLRIEDVTSKSLSIETAYSHLRDVSTSHKENQKEHGNAQIKQKEWVTQMNEKQQLFEAMSNEILVLWSEAQVNNESAFYEADNAFREKQSVQHNLLAINAQLDSIGKIDLANEVEQNLLLSAEQLDMELTNLLENRNELYEEKASLKQQTSSMLSDESYGQSLQQFEQKKAELAELAHKWSVNKAITEAINQTMYDLKEKRLPFVLNQAQQFFNHLTNGRYDSLEVNEDGIFEAVNPQGIRFRIAELSQATKEQAYISLRFALAESLVNSIPLPVVMDDPFVHFDRFRVKQMVQLMTDLEINHQFLYFTCHEDMTTIWPHAHVIDVAALQKERSVPFI